uniref:Uncharacterized protein n=1 Tax=Moniliophthora roreri TaxID=221103 RepID=A0A0W0FYG5_MONRR
MRETCRNLFAFPPHHPHHQNFAAPAEDQNPGVLTAYVLIPTSCGKISILSRSTETMKGDYPINSVPA